MIYAKWPLCSLKDICYEINTQAFPERKSIVDSAGFAIDRILALHPGHRATISIYRLSTVLNGAL
jgi:hypothetical protein